MCLRQRRPLTTESSQVSTKPVKIDLYTFPNFPNPKLNNEKEILSMFIAIFIGIVVMCLTMAAASALHRGRVTTGGGSRPNVFARFFANIRSDGWITASIYGVAAFLVRWLAPMSVKWAWTGVFAWMFPALFLAVMIGLMAYLIYWWRSEGSEVRELVWFILLAFVLTFITGIAAGALADVIGMVFWTSVLVTLPWLIFVCVIGHLLYNIFTFHAGHASGNAAKACGVLRWVAVGLAGLIALILLISGVKWNALKWPAKTTVDEPTIETSWYKFYHYDLLKDNDKTDDFNFGPNANPDGTVAKAKAEHYARVEKDPALGVATFANFDVRLGTDFMEPGYHYDQNQSDGMWTTRINSRIQYYMAHQDEYQEAVKRWETFVDKYATVTLTHEEGLTDQMYMVSYGAEDEAPEVVIAKTDQPDGWMLSYNFLIKGNDFTVPFRTDCGDQPTNLAEPMKEQPKENPSDPQ